jgi:hypothetical protein
VVRRRVAWIIIVLVLVGMAVWRLADHKERFGPDSPQRAAVGAREGHQRVTGDSGGGSRETREGAGGRGDETF